MKNTLSNPNDDRGAKRDGNAVVVKLLEQRSDWNGWLEDPEHVTLHWPHVAALLLRDVPVDRIVEPFCRALNEIAIKVDIGCAQAYNVPQARDRKPIRFEDWMALWSDESSADAMRNELLALAKDYEGDAAYGLKALASRESGVEAVLWFLAGAIAQWFSSNKDTSLTQRICSQYIWLTSIDNVPGDRAIEHLFVALYIEFSERGGCPAELKPAEMAWRANMIDVDLYSSTFEISRPLNQTLIMVDQWPNVLLNILGRGPEWPGAAENIRVARSHGLIIGEGLLLTEQGRDALQHIYLRNDRAYFR